MRLFAFVIFSYKGLDSAFSISISTPQLLHLRHVVCQNKHWRSRIKEFRED